MKQFISLVITLMLLSAPALAGKDDPQNASPGGVILPPTLVMVR